MSLSFSTTPIMLFRIMTSDDRVWMKWYRKLFRDVEICSPVDALGIHRLATNNLETVLDIGVAQPLGLTKKPHAGSPRATNCIKNAAVHNN